MWLWYVWHFLTQNGVGQNLLASAILGIPTFLRVKHGMNQHHVEQLAQNAQHHLEQLAQNKLHHDEQIDHINRLADDRGTPRD